MPRTNDQDRAILQARETFIASHGDVDGPLAIRPEIAASWQRSITSLVDPTKALPDFQRLGETQLSAAALPVIDHHLTALTGTRTSLLFADAAGRLIGRWTHDSTLRKSLNTSYVEAGFSMAEGVVGTNGVGTVFEAGAAVEIKGPEHFSDQYLAFTCVGAPIRHPLTRRIVGVIDITCRFEDSSPLAMPWILNLARHIETQLLDQATVRERALLSAYLMTARKSHVAVACLDGQMLICNPAASALLSENDQSHIWAQLQRRDFRSMATFVPVELPGARVLMIRAKAVRHDGVLAGAVVEAFEPPTATKELSRQPASPPASLDGLVGVSDRWTNVCDQAARWRREGGGIVVVGEPGVGKLAVLSSTFADETQLTVLQCSLVLADGRQEWLSALRTRLSDPEGLVVLRHLHLLDEAMIQAVCGLLDQADSPPRLAATLAAGRDEGPLRPLLDRVEDHRLDVPPLRRRVDDLPALLMHLSRRNGGDGPRWLAETVGVLADQAWPDNVRSLDALVRRIVRRRPIGVVTIADLPDDLVGQPASQRNLTQLERLERQEIVETLISVEGNKLLAAKKLNLARSTLYRKMASLGIRQESPGSRPTH